MDLELVDHLIGGQLVRAEKAHQRNASEYLKNFGLQLDQEMLFLSLQREEGMTLSQLASMHGLDLSTITRIVRGLEQEGLVECRVDGDDARIARVYLTERGHMLCRPALQMWFDLEDQLIQGLSESECVLLHRLLSTIASNLER